MERMPLTVDICQDGVYAGKKLLIRDSEGNEILGPRQLGRKESPDEALTAYIVQAANRQHAMETKAYDIVKLVQHKKIELYVEDWVQGHPSTIAFTMTTDPLRARRVSQGDWERWFASEPKKFKRFSITVGYTVKPVMTRKC